MLIMTDRPATLHSTPDGDEYRNGRGKVIAIGDFVKVAKATGRFHVVDFRVEDNEVYITVYGGPKGRLLFRTFHVDRCSRTKSADNNAGLRDAVAESSDRSKRGKRPS